MHGDRNSLSAKVRRRAKVLRARIPFGASMRFVVRSVPAFKVAHAVATVVSNSQHRAEIRLRAGTYRMTVECSNGVDLVGESGATIEWRGPRDTLDLNGTDARIARLTIRHLGPDFYYAVHADSPGPGGAELVSVNAFSDSKSALGVGLQPGQAFTARDSHFERGIQGLLSEPVLAHNSHLGMDGPLVFERCTAHSATGGRVSVWTDALTGESRTIPGIREAPASLQSRDVGAECRHTRRT